MASGNHMGQRSIFSSIVVPIILLLMISIGLFASILGASGVFGQLNQNNRDILAQQVESRKNTLENYFVGSVGDLSSLSALINSRTQERLDSGELDLATMDSGASETMGLVESLIDPLITTLRTKRVNGAFVIFNTHDLSPAYESGSFGKKPGVYIFDMDPTATPSSRNDDLVIKRGSADVVAVSSITTDNYWKPLFDFTKRANPEDFDFFYRPWQTAYETEGPKEASDYAYWGISPFIGNASLYNVSYTIPLILDDGTVYGIVGVHLAPDYVSSLLPYNEIASGEEGSYVLGISHEDNMDASSNMLEIHPVVISNKSGTSTDVGAHVELTKLEDDSISIDTSEGSFVASYEYFRLYNNNAPFENDRWVLIGTVPEDFLHRFSNRVLLMIALASLLMLVVGVLGSVLIGRTLSNPLKKLADDVENAQLTKAEMPNLAKTGITEVDSLTGAISTLSKDISSIKQLEQQRIEHERNFDLLTGLTNRRALYRRAEAIFAEPETVKHAALLFLDLDDMKRLNDEHGHYWGDKYIYQVARCLEESVPEDVLIARDSGDEFSMLFFGYDSREDIEADIGLLRDAIPLHTVATPDGNNIAMRVSGGAAFYPEDSQDFSELVKLADFTMYQVKITDKNSIAFFNEENYQKERAVLRAHDELDALLTNSELCEYHFQPIFDAHTGSLYAYEALMRVAMDYLRSPADVLTLARREKRVGAVEDLTWTRALSTYNQLRNHGEVKKGAFLFINSFASVAPSDDVVRKINESYPDLLSNVVIEVTETEDIAEEAMEAKRRIPGFSGLFALDDYGSGYNSEVMLLHLKPKFVKVDISIVRDIDSSSDKQRIVGNLVKYAHERDMFIIAEGVETAEELAVLLELDIDYLQGFYLARPARVPGTLSLDVLTQIQKRG